MTPTIVNNVGIGCAAWHALFQRADEVDGGLEGTVGAVDRSSATTASGLKANAFEVGIGATPDVHLRPP